MQDKNTLPTKDTTPTIRVIGPEPTSMEMGGERCPVCNGHGELVVRGGVTLTLDNWSGDDGDFIDCPKCGVAE